MYYIYFQIVTSVILNKSFPGIIVFDSRIPPNFYMKGYLEQVVPCAVGRQIHSTSRERTVSSQDCFLRLRSFHIIYTQNRMILTFSWRAKTGKKSYILEDKTELASGTIEWIKGRHSRLSFFFLLQSSWHPYIKRSTVQSSFYQNCRWPTWIALEDRRWLKIWAQSGWFKIPHEPCHYLKRFTV